MIFLLLFGLFNTNYVVIDFNNTFLFLQYNLQKTLQTFVHHNLNSKKKTMKFQTVNKNKLLQLRRVNF